MTVQDIIVEQNESKAHTYEFVLWPRQWSAHSSTDTFSWNSVRLSLHNSPAVPTTSGIYTLLVQPGLFNHPACSYLMYVGQAKSLRRRFSDYLNREKRSTGRPKIFRLLNMYPNQAVFCFTIIPASDLDRIESALLNAFIPPCNDRFPAEVQRIIGAFR